MKILSFIQEVFEQFPSLLILTVLLLLLVNLLSACSLITLSPITDLLIHPDLNEVSPLTLKVARFLKFFSPSVTLQGWLIAFVGFIFLSSLFQILAHHFVIVIRYKVLRNVLMGTFEDFFSAKWSFFSGASQGVLLNTFTREFDVFSQCFRAVAEMFSTVAQVVISLLIPIYISKETTLVSFGIVLFVSVPFYIFAKYSYKLGHINTQAANALTSTIYENLSFAKLLLGYGNFQKDLDRLESIYDRRQKSAIKWQTAAISIPLVYRPLAAVVIIVTLIMARYFGMSLSEIVVLIAALFQLALSVGKLHDKQNAVAGSIPSYEQIKRLRSRAQQMKQFSGSLNFVYLKDAIELKDLSFAHPYHPATIKNISMRIAKGEMIALVGKSGAGKSTLVDMIMGFHEPASGSILLDGVPLHNYDINSYRRRIGYVPQDSMLFNMSVRDNLLWANPQASFEDLRRACRMAYAAEFIEKLSGGYNTLVGDRGVRLSGGQIQRIALARAFLRKPDLFLLDEATSALDTESESIIQKAIETFSGEATMIIVAHRLSTIKKVDCIYVLDHGQIIEKGTYKDLACGVGHFNTMIQFQELVA